jgi:16S rRNA (guanine527-N7)-methyltransferase
MLSPHEALAGIDVPRGTIDRLLRYEVLLREWQGRMNLVGPSTLADPWRRHFQDSAQLALLAPRDLRWLDIGAGAGFPGLVLAAMEWGTFTLVEAIAKKCRFLEAVAAALKLTGVQICCARVETLPPQHADIVTARATASLEQLLEWSLPHLKPGGMCLFPKGRSFADEIAAAHVRFTFDHQAVPSRTDPDARIIQIVNARKRDQ